MKYFFGIIALFIAFSVSAQRHVVVISIDGFRAEMYLDTIWPTPNLQKLLREGSSAQYMTSVFPAYTYPAHAAMLSGALPAKTRVAYNTPRDSKGEWHWFTKDIKAPTLWDAMAQKGLTSSAVQWPISVGGNITYNIPEIWDPKHGEDRITETRKYATPGLIEEIEKNATGILDSTNMNEEHLSMDANAARMAAYIFKTRRPNFLALHFASVDGAGHAHGRYHEQVRLAIANADQGIGLLLETIQRSGLQDSTTVFIVGDHGMTTMHTAIRINTLIKDLPARFHSAGGSCFLYLKAGASIDVVDSVMHRLQQFNTANPGLFTVYNKGTLVKLGADQDAVLALSAKPGYVLGMADTGAVFFPVKGGHHGYHPNQPEMHTGFIAAGAGIKKDYRFRTLCVTDIAPLVAELLNVSFHSPDGKLPSEILDQQIVMTTPWTDKVDTHHILLAYPRPQMVRSNWINLNGAWDYAITDSGAMRPKSFNGKIIVPFPVESLLSGVQKALLPSQELWYKKVFAAPLLKKDEQLLLHFGAVDQIARVYINDQSAGTHAGGFDPFTINVTPFLKKGDNEIIVAVQDATDKGNYPHGKQTLKPMWTRYTAVSGIWQTVWLEKVPTAHISSLQLTPDIDRGVLRVQVNSTAHVNVEIITSTGDKLVGAANRLLNLTINSLHLWSPEDPFLYEATVRLMINGKIVDTVHTYFGMRKVNIQQDSQGIERIYLNNQPYFQLGLLDQGYWPDGLFTAASDEALAYDINVAKQMGFNTIRKHVKIEPARWYYHCDRLGMLVWQDMPSWRQPRELPTAYAKHFAMEMTAHVQQLYNYPSIAMWCLFNEDWGAHDQESLSAALALLDTTRVINSNSGSFKENWAGAQVTDRHMYPNPTLPPYEAGNAMVCGEFGGTYQAVKGHEWLDGKGWGHPSPPGFRLEERYRDQIEELKLLKRQGLSGAIYTQPYDVETEENGIYSYDRKVFKLPVERVREINGGVKVE